ncbi:peptidoglycan recognition protein [Streptomyces ovatisporus]|uniref:Peptidoglycan recognition protein n=1 Tax=Streptomyces ovatisporus TaxID=1128682 RepID=A0ABV9AAH0_9ACTN
MRALLVTSIGVACAGALLLLPLTPTESADSTLPGDRSAPAEDAAPPAARDVRAESGTGVPGSTQSLPLGAPSDSTRSGDKLLSAWEDDPSGGRRVASRKVKPFSLVGVVWEDAGAEPRGQLQVQTRASGSGRWSSWRSLDTHGGHSPEAGSKGRSGERALGSTAPLWAGNSDAVRVRIVPHKTPTRTTGQSNGQEQGNAELPGGARLELVDPGPGTPSGGAGGREQREGGDPEPGAGQASGQTSGQASGGAADEAAGSHEQRPGGVLPAMTKAQTRATYGDEAADATSSRSDRPQDTHIGPRPDIVTRKGWGADESMREKEFSYSKSIKAAFVHHSAETNDYTCGQVPSIIRGIYRYHVKSSRWRDLGYNFLVDKCGKIYEGRAGGMARAVMGAHTFGFNADTTGIAVLGTYSKETAPKAVTEALAKLTAWKLGVHGVDARGKVTLTSGGGTKHKKGTKVSFNAVSGHRDGFVTECPGEKLYSELPAIRNDAGRLQGR